MKIDKAKIGDFFYYYKWHVILISLLVIAVGSTVYVKMNEIKPDLTVLLISKTYVPDPDVEALENKLSNYIADVNNDGRKKVYVSQINVRENPISEQDTTAYSRIYLEMTAGDPTVFMMEDFLKKKFESEGIFRTLPFANSMYFPLADNKVIGNLLNAKTLVAAERVVKPSEQKDSKMLKQFENADKIIDLFYKNQ